MAAFRPATPTCDAGLAALTRADLVSLVLVPDPFASPPPDRLAAAFELCRPFKTHYLVETARREFSKHHRDRVRRGQRRCRVDRVVAGGLPGRLGRALRRPCRPPRDPRRGRFHARLFRQTRRGAGTGRAGRVRRGAGGRR